MKEFALYFLIAGTAALLLGGSAMAAFLWALKSGQFHDPEGSSKSIFDPDEYEGKVTDTFPQKNEYRNPEE